MRDPSSLLASSDKLKIFVSSTIGECKLERAAAVKGIKATNHEPILFEQLGARPYPPRDVYLSRLRQADIAVAIFRDNYGYIDTGAGMTISGVEDEYRHIRLWRKYLLAYIRVDQANRDSKLTALIGEITASGVTVSFYDEPEELEARIRDDVTALATQRFFDAASMDAALRQTSATIIAAITRPMGRLVVRNSLVDEISAAIRQNGIVCIAGPPGIGKTVLATQFSQQFGYPLVLADRLSPKDLFGVLANKLRGATPEDAVPFATLDGARSAFVSAWTEASQATIIVDDSPHIEAVKAAIAEAGGAGAARALVFTAREAPVGEAIVVVPPLRSHEIADMIGAAGRSADATIISRLVTGSGGNPLLVRQALLTEGRSTQHTWNGLAASAREIATYAAIANIVLSIEDFLRLRGDPSYGPENLIDDFDRMPGLIVGTGAGFRIVHEQVRSELLSAIKERPERFQFAASRLGRYLAQNGNVVRAYFLLVEAGNLESRELLKEASYEAARSGDQIASIRILKDVLGVAQGEGDASEATRISVAIAQTHEMMGDMQAAARSLADAESLSTTADSDAQLFVREFGIGFRGRRNQTPDSINELVLLRNDLKASGREWHAARMAIELSAAYLHAHDAPGAEREAREALRIFEEKEDGYGVDVARRNLASALVAQQGREQEAEAAIRAVELHADPKETRRHRAWLCNLMVRQRRQEGRLDEAQERAQEAITIGRELGDEVIVAINLIGLANVFSDLKRFDEAIQTYNLAAASGQRCARRDIEAHASYLIANTYNELPDDHPDHSRAAELAEVHARHAIGLLRGTIGRDHLWRAHEALGDALQVQGRRQDAIDAYFAGAAVLRDIQMWDAFERLFMLGCHIAADENPESFLSGIGTVFALPLPATDPAPTPVERIYAPFSALVQQLPQSVAIPCLGLYFKLLFTGLPDLIARHMFDTALQSLLQPAATGPAALWRVAYSALVLAAARGRILSACDLSRVAGEIAEALPGLHARPIPEGGTHWLLILNLPKETAITITPLDERPDSILACLLVALFLKGFEEELSRDILSGIPLKSELTIVVANVASAPDDIQQQVLAAMGDAPVQTSRPVNVQQAESQPAYVFLADNFAAGLSVGEGRGGHLQILLGLCAVEVAYRLLGGQVDIEVLKPKIVQLVLKSTS